MSDETHEQKAPFLLTAESRTPTKSKDKIDVQYDPDWSAMRTGRAERPMFCYVVRNLTKPEHGPYTVEFFEDDSGQPHGFCNCQAKVVCKHIKYALEDLLEAHPEFGGLETEPVDCPVNDPSCEGADGQCHDACQPTNPEENNDAN